MQAALLILGLIVGSFLNVCIYRIPAGESIIYPPSSCPGCGRRIKGYDMIPVLSYVFLKGKCRYCHSRISIQYPLIEAFTGCMFLMLYIKFGLSYELFKNLILSVFVEICAVIDFETHDVYSSLSYPLMIIGLINVIISKAFFHEGIMTYVIGCLVPAAIIWIIGKASAGFGEGDIDIFAAIGLFLGAKLSFLTLFLSVIIGGGAGAALLFMKKKKPKAEIAFVPFIFIAMFISILFGNELLEAYWSFL